MAASRKTIATVAMIAITLGGCAQTGSPNGRGGSDQASAGQTVATGAVLGAVIGGIAGNRLGIGSFGGALAGAAIGGAMGAILHQLTVEEQQSRQVALQRAARSGRSSWSSRGPNGKRASYQRLAFQEVGGQQCHQVQETIVLPDGQRGQAVETVCF